MRGSRDDRSVVLVDGYFLRAAQVLKPHVVEFDSEILGDGFAARRVAACLSGNAGGDDRYHSLAW